MTVSIAKNMTNYVIHWGFDPVIFALGALQIRWYGVLWASAFLLGQQFVSWMYRNEKQRSSDSDRLLVYLLIGTVVGARLGHCLIYDPVYYLNNPLAILKTWEGGMASHGGAAGLLLALWLYSRRFPVPSFLWLLDRIAIPAAFGGALIRFANFLGSDIVGRPTSGTWGVVFDAVDSLPRHPVQLYESAAYLAVFALLLALYSRKHTHAAHGLFSGLFLFLVFLARVILEFFKEPQAAYEAGLTITVGQWLSLPFLLAGSFLVAVAMRKSRRQPKH